MRGLPVRSTVTNFPVCGPVDASHVAVWGPTVGAAVPWLQRVAPAYVVTWPDAEPTHTS